MKPGDLEDLTLFLIRDAAEGAMWIDRWALSYPMVAGAECGGGQPFADQQQAVARSFAQICGGHVMVVAYGAGAAAFVAWYARLGLVAQRRIKGVILVDPPREVCVGEGLRHIRLMCGRVALVVGENSSDCPLDWAREQAGFWGARLLVSPHEGRLNGLLGGWQWGMKLMQEMLLA